MVFCSQYQSEDEARATLLANLEGEAAVRAAAAQVQGRPAPKAWDKNVVSMGLASGFIEPLESTSIHLIQIGVTRLMQLFPFGGITQALINRYNDQSRIEYERIRDFIILHYKLTERDDTPFWRDCRDMPIPDFAGASASNCSARARMAYQATDEMFRVESWMQVMLGQRLQPARLPPHGPHARARAPAQGARHAQGQHRRRGARRCPRTVNS